MKYFFAAIYEYPWIAFFVAIFVLVVIDKITTILMLQITLIEKRNQRIIKDLCDKKTSE